MLKIKNYSKVYKNEIKAVNNLSLEVNSGDIYAFIGHNGAGKSTTLKSIVGILDYNEGEILIDGLNIKDNPIECKKVIAYIPDNPEIYESLTGIQYINFIADMYEVPVTLREKLIKKYADKFEITDKLGDLISSYSHGMKQKVTIIASVLHKPKLLVLDEPFVGLDPKAIVVLKNIMKELCNAGSAIFYATHVLDVAEKLCNKVGMINKGKLVINSDMESLIRDKSLESIFMEVLENGE